MQVHIDLPLPDAPVFRYGAADEILDLAASHPNRVFTNREFRRLTGYGGPSVQNALDLLTTLDLLDATERGGRTEYGLNGDRVDGPTTGIAAIPQSEFHPPIRAFRDHVVESVSDLHGVVVFGSVARGDADRRSDIDVFLAVASDPPTDARRAVADVVASLEERRYDGQRYSFDHHVESLAGTRAYGDRILTIVNEGIPIVRTDEFDDVRESIIDDASTTGRD